MIRLLTSHDLPQVETYLNQFPVETVLTSGNIDSFGIENDGVASRCANYYGYFHGGLMEGIIAFYNAGSCVPHYTNSAAVAPFIDLLANKSFQFLCGPESVITPLYWGICRSRPAQVYEESYYCVNRSVIPVSTENRQVCDAGEVEQRKAVSFVLQAFRAGFDSEITEEQARHLLYKRPKGEEYLFLLERGEIVAQASIQAASKSGEQIGGVFTDPKRRGQGCCKQLVSALCTHIVARGRTPSLVVRKQNRAALSAYEKIGFEPCSNYVLARFGASSRNGRT